jgi:hypothetical protein
MSTTVALDDAARAVLGAVDARRRRDVDELEGRRLPVEGAGAVAGDDEDVQVPVPLEVGDGDAGLDRAERQLAEAVAPHARVVVEVLRRHARVLGGHDLEELFPGGAGRRGRRGVAT